MRPVPISVLLVVIALLSFGTFVACGSAEQSDSSEKREDRTSSQDRESRAPRNASETDPGTSSAIDLSGGPTDLIPADTEFAIVFDVSDMLGEKAPGFTSADFEDWSTELLDGEVDLEDIDTLVVVGDSLLLLQGDFNSDEIRDNLEDAGYEAEEYRNFETWGERAALIEDEDIVVLAFVSEALRDLLRSLDMGRDLLAFETGSDISLLLEDAGSASFTVVVIGDCDSDVVMGCTAAGGSQYFQDPEDDATRIRLFVILEDEESAEDALEILEEDIEDLPSYLELRDASTDGNTVVIEYDVEGTPPGDFFDMVSDGPVPGGVRPVASSNEATAAPIAAPTEAPSREITNFGEDFSDAERINPGDVVDLRLGRYENHFFEFNAQRGRTYIIETDADFDSYLELYDESGDYLIGDDDGGSGSSAMIQWTAESSGNYAVMVSGYSSDDSGNYILLLTTLDPDDHAGSFDDATRVSANDVAEGSIVAGDEDFFVIDTRRDGIYIFETHGLDTIIELFDEDGYTLAYDDDGGSNGGSRLSWTVSSPENLYLVVSGYDSYSTGSYELSVTQLEPDDHGNSTRSATRLDSNDMQDGSILPNEEDFFVFDGRRGRSYTVEADAQFDFVVEILDDSGYVMNSLVSAAGQPVEWQFAAPTSASYYIVVRGYISDYVGTYELSISESR